ncbi:MAG: hypothetical protein L6290_01855 [Thermodesulfovibrionales bacterium]|nr:hypothetical protein [Thermodesulfovibrionales bacterium]
MPKGIKYDFVVSKPHRKGQKYHHLILTDGADFEACREKVFNFFQHYQLVRYFNTHIAEEKSLSAAGHAFRDTLDQAIRKNRTILHKLTSELQDEGIQTLTDLEQTPQGYRTNMLHVITHLLDGFFGIDSYFYNLVEDSHWVSEELRATIKTSPSRYWLIAVEADFK